MEDNKYEILIEQLHDKGYDDLYNSIKEADKYYETDHKMYCRSCRIILEYFVEKIEEIINIPILPHNNSPKGRIQKLSTKVEIDNELANELTNMRKLGNFYLHEQKCKDKIYPDKDRVTFRIAIIKITDKLLVLPEIYQKAEEERQRKKAEIERKRREAEEAEKRRKHEAEIERKRREAEIERKRREELRKERVEHAKRKKRQQKWAVAGGILAGALFVVGLLFGGGSKRD